MTAYTNGWSNRISSGSRSCCFGQRGIRCNTIGENSWTIAVRKVAAPANIWLNQLGIATRLPCHGIHRCFERVNQLLSLLVPVSDINRVAVGGGRRAPVPTN
jgi:hypothetical protein